MPGVSRRGFLRAAGGSAAALIGAGVGPFGLGDAAGMFFRAGPPVRIAVLFEPGFPGSDDFSVTREQLAAAMEGHTVEFLGAADTAAKLPDGGYDLMVNPYGAAFPVDCWIAIRKYLERGGSLLHLGGTPFSIPVRKEGASWRQEIHQTSYYKNLGITESFAVELASGIGLRDLPRNGATAALARGISASRVHELYVKFTSTRDYPSEDGTSGQRDASISPLVGAFTVGGDMIAAPVVVIDRLLGAFAGGRWVLANYTGTISGGALRELVNLAVARPIQAAAVPSFASYFPGETPAVRLVAREAKSGSALAGGEWRIGITDGKKFNYRTTIGGKDLEKTYASAWVMPASAARNLRPGFHAIEAEYHPPGGDDPRSERVVANNGFWIYDADAMRGGGAVTARGNAFYRDGRPYPVTGTSYMSEGVQRKFLFEPNPYLWDQDFRAMKEAGVNMIRTGVWTGWKNIMLDVGSVNEYPLRSLDAFILCARRYDIPVIFTFFAFLPEAWGGENPYLDPRSLQAQKSFVTAIAGRYRNAPGVIWDLINEPSFSSPGQLWLCRPNYDRHEAAEWKAWLSTQVIGADSASAAGIIRERYRLTAGESPDLPPLPEFRESNLIGIQRPLRAGDYRLFAQEMFKRWTAGLASVLKAGGAGQMVTVGQDEGGVYERPGPHFFGSDVDFTSMHNWWYNDDILWDSLMSAVPGKPNLIEETGVMTYEKADGRPWRTEAETGDLLERKLAIAFGTGAAGFIHWLWNTNQYMDSDNEAGIGLRRPDGSLKPEYDVVRQYSRFFAAHAAHLGERTEEDAVLVIPHSNMFSTRNSATEATKTAVRALEYRCRIPVRTVSEYAIPAPGAAPVPPLLIFPSPGMIDRGAWERLLALVQSGSTLLITGPIDDDAHLMPAGRSAAVGVAGENVTIGAEEHLLIDGREFRLGFRGDKMQRLQKFLRAGTAPPEAAVIPSGKGTILWSPIPVELSDSADAVAALYRFAAARAGLTTTLRVDTDDPSVLARPVVFREALMLVFVSEAAVARRVSGTLTESGAPFSVEVPARRSLVHIHDRKTGRLLAALNPSHSDAF